MFSAAAVEACLLAIGEEVEEKVRNVNCGGCGVYAVELAKRLHKLGITDCKIRAYGDRYEVDISEVENTNFRTNKPTHSSEWNRNGVWFHHVKVEWNGALWDSEGKVSLDRANTWNWSKLQKGSISDKAMRILTKLASNWNSWFERDQIPKIRRIMNKHFRKLLESDQLPLFA